MKKKNISKKLQPKDIKVEKLEQKETPFLFKKVETPSQNCVSAQCDYTKHRWRKGRY